MRRHAGRQSEPNSHRSAYFQMFAVLRSGRWGAVIVTILSLLGPWPSAYGAVSAASSLSMKPSLPSGQPTGTTITWTASSAGLSNPVYRFSVAPQNGPFSIVRDFSSVPAFSWTTLHEGEYQIRATVKDGFTAKATSDAVVSFTITSRITGKTAVVSLTPNPLVALYSAPACSTGIVTVQFRPATGSTPWQSTASQPCSAGKSVNALVAGLRASTPYLVRHVVAMGSQRVTSSPLTFTAGKVPAGLKITPFVVKRSAHALPFTGSSAIFHALIPTPSPTLANPIATDPTGQLVWYYDTLHSGLTNIWPVRILSGGTVLLLGLDRTHTTGDNVLREVDLASDTVRETNVDVVDAQLASRGQEPIYMFHHDALRLPNGDTAVLGATQNRVSGHDVMGDMVVVLDSNFQVVWTWDMFDHYTPPATWPTGTGICSVLCALPDPKSLDWTHGNDIGWSPQDGNLIVSFRSLSWVIKIDYRNGRGNGTVLWRLGKDGDFTLKSSDPYPWFSQQHNATYVSATNMVIFDDGNTRCQNGKVKGCQSRGQVYRLDEQHHVATLVVNAKLGRFWQALGSAQMLPDGDTFFAGGFSPPSKEVEVRPNGTREYELDAPIAEYRAYWLAGLSF